MDKHEKAATALRAPLPLRPRMQDYIRYASLAANAHNTQAWRFDYDKDRVSIRPDFSRRTGIVDPDDHHLYISLGCAAENLAVAAAARGRSPTVTYVDIEDGRVEIELGEGAIGYEELCKAIPQRQSTRCVYDGQPVHRQDLVAMQTACSQDGVSVKFFTDTDAIEDILKFVIAGNSAQMDDTAFVAELKHWIRFSNAQALKTGDGLAGTCMRNPSAPEWIGKLMFGLAFKKGSENMKLQEQIRSSSGIAVFTAEEEGRAHWVEVGRSFERFALQATALGIRHAHINQPVEVPEVRAQFAEWLGCPDKRPDLVIRFGYAPPLPMSLRRPVAEIAL